MFDEEGRGGENWGKPAKSGNIMTEHDRSQKNGWGPGGEVPLRTATVTVLDRQEREEIPRANNGCPRLDINGAKSHHLPLATIIKIV